MRFLKIAPNAFREYRFDSNLVRHFSYGRGAQIGGRTLGHFCRCEIETVTQAAEREDILNISRFPDQVFNVIAAFAKNELNADHWNGVIEAVVL